MFSFHRGHYSRFRNQPTKEKQHEFVSSPFSTRLAATSGGFKTDKQPAFRVTFEGMEFSDFAARTPSNLPTFLLLRRFIQEELKNVFITDEFECEDKCTFYLETEDASRKFTITATRAPETASVDIRLSQDMYD